MQDGKTLGNYGYMGENVIQAMIKDWRGSGIEWF